MTDDGWYRASRAKSATFAFLVEKGVVVRCAPYGRSLIKGLPYASAEKALKLAGFEVERMKDEP